jgi:HSP20 family molecular chaperone IbpA
MTNYISRFDNVFKPFDSVFQCEISGNEEGPRQIEFNVAGIKKNNVSVVIEGNLLRVKGEGDGARGDYSKTVRLPPDVDTDSITATYEDGLLIVDIDKKSTSKVIDIK